MAIWRSSTLPPKPKKKKSWRFVSLRFYDQQVSGPEFLRPPGCQRRKLHRQAPAEFVLFCLGNPARKESPLAPDFRPRALFHRFFRLQFRTVKPDLDRQS